MKPETLSRVMEATWPAARVWTVGPFTFRDGAGGGKRVSAASSDGNWTMADLAALADMAEPLVLIRPADAELDAALAERGWRVVDPVVVYAAPVDDLRAELPPLAAFPHWPPLAIACSLWEEGGVGRARLAVMERAAGPKAAILARDGDRPAGVAFVACEGTEAMLHALEVRPDCRRRGVGTALLQSAAVWAADTGAARMSLAVTERNSAARALYARLGMQVVGQYHYRVK
jgi:ribosomal protein S18 acetylase RimI-like enzyme